MKQFIPPQNPTVQWNCLAWGQKIGALIDRYLDTKSLPYLHEAMEAYDQANQARWTAPGKKDPAHTKNFTNLIKPLGDIIKDEVRKAYPQYQTNK